MKLQQTELLQACQGIWHGQALHSIEYLCSDSRDIQQGAAFIALKGPHFDGHDFCQTAIEQGASLLIVTHDYAEQHAHQSIPMLAVDDTQQAYEACARHWRQQCHYPIIAIIGSAGKTTLRSMLHHACQQYGLHSHANIANHNNRIGVAQTLLKLPAQADIGFIECGISELGEMQHLADMTQPDALVFTQLSPAHTQGLGSLHTIAHEKASMLQKLDTTQPAFLGMGVARTLQQAGISLRPKDIDLRQQKELFWQLQGQTFCLQSQQQKQQWKLALPAQHWADNLALAAYTLMHLLPFSLTDIAACLSTWQAPAGRLQSITGRQASRILNDSYNANPASMQAAIDTLKQLPGKRIAIIADMLELGTISQSAHQNLDLTGLQQCLLIGPAMTTALAKKYPQASCFNDVQAARSAVQGLKLDAHCTVLLKGSRGMHLEHLLDTLTES